MQAFSLELENTLQAAIDDFSTSRIAGVYEPNLRQRTSVLAINVMVEEKMKRGLAKTIFDLRLMLANSRTDATSFKSALSRADSVDSLGFLDTDVMNESVFGPNIPDDKKPVVTKVMEKMASLWEQKKNNRVRVLQHWRIMRMTEKLKLLKSHNQAYLKLLKLSRKPYNAFFTILSHSQRVSNTTEDSVHKLRAYQDGSDFGDSQTGRRSVDQLSSPIAQRLGFDSMMPSGPHHHSYHGGSRPLYDSNISITEDANEDGVLAIGTPVTFNNEELFADGTGRFVSSSGRLVDISPEDALQLNSGQDNLLQTIPKGILITYEEAKLISDGKGGIIGSSGKSTFTPEQLAEIHAQMLEVHLKNLESEKQKNQESYKLLTEQGKILPEGILEKYSGIKIYANGRGGFRGLDGLPINIPQEVKDYLNGVNRGKFALGTSIFFKGERLVHDGEGGYTDERGKAVVLDDEVKAYLSPGCSLKKGDKITFNGIEHFYNGLGAFTNSAGELEAFPDNILAWMLSGANGDPEVRGFAGTGISKPFGQILFYNGKKLITNGRGGFLDEYGRPYIMNPSIINQLNGLEPTASTFYSFEDRVEVPRGGIEMTFNGKTYKTDGRGGFLHSDGTPACLPHDLVAWMNGFTVSKSSPTPEAGIRRSYNGVEYISDGKGGWTDETGKKVPLEDSVIEWLNTEELDMLPTRSRVVSEFVTTPDPSLRLQEELNKAQRIIIEMEESLSRKEEQIQSKMELIKEKDEILASRSKSLKEKDAQIEKEKLIQKEFEKIKTGLESEIQDLQTELKKKEGEISIFKDSSKQTDSDAKGALHQLRLEVESLRIDVERKTAELEKLTSNNILLSKSLEAKEDQVRLLNERSKEVIERTDQQIAELRSNIKDKDAKSKDLDAELRRTNEELERVRRESEKLLDNISKSREFGDSKKDEVNSQKQLIKVLEDKVIELEKRVDSLSLEAEKERKIAAESEGKLSKIKEELTSAINTEVSLKERLNESAQTLKAKDESLKALETSYKKQITEQEAKSKIQLEEAIKKFNDFAKSKSESDKELTHKLAESEKERTHLKQELSAQIDQLKESKIKEIGDLIQRITGEQSSNSEKLIERQNLLKSERDKEREEINQQINNIVSNLAKKKKKYQKKHPQNGDVIEEDENESNEDFSDEDDGISEDVINQLVDLKVRQEKINLRDKYEDRIDLITGENIELKNRLAVSDRENSELKELTQSLKDRLAALHHEYDERIGGLFETIQTRIVPIQQQQPISTPSHASSKPIQFNEIEKTRNRNLFLQDVALVPVEGVKPPSLRTTPRTNTLVPFPHGQVLSNLRKARLMNTSIVKILKNHKLRAFMQIFANYIKDVRAMNEAPARLKGRLLLVMSQRYYGSDVKTSFQRWWIFTNRTYVRDCITRIALTARINHQTALWRFKGLVTKRMKYVLPEATKNLRLAKALGIMNKFMATKDKLAIANGYNKFRPLICPDKLRVFNHCIKNRILRDQISKRKALDSLRERNRKMKKLVVLLKKKLLNNATQAMDRLSSNKNALKTAEFDRVIGALCISTSDILKKYAEENIQKSLGIGTFSATSKAQRNVIDKLGKLMPNSKLREALNKLRNHRNKMSSKQTSEKQKKTSLFKKLVIAQNVKAKEICSELAKNNNLIKSKEALRSAKETTIIANLLKALQGKRWQGFDKLTRNNFFGKMKDATDLSAAEKQKLIKNKLVRKLVRAQILKSGDALNNLKVYTKTARLEEVEKLRRRMNFLNYLISGSRGKLYACVDSMRENSLEIGNSDALSKLKQEKCLNSMMNHLAKGRDNGLRQAYERLKDNSDEETRLQRLQKAQMDEEERRRFEMEANKFRAMRLLSRGIVRSHEAKMLQCVVEARHNMLKEKAREERELLQSSMEKEVKDRAIRKLLGGLVAAQKKKAHMVTAELRKNNELTNALNRLVDADSAFRNKIRDKLIKGLGKSLFGQLRAAYMKLKANNAEEQAQAQKRRRITNTILIRLTRACRAKESDVIQGIRRDVANAKAVEAADFTKGSGLIKKVLAHISSKKKRDAYHAYAIMLEYGRKKQTTNAVLSKLFRGIVRAQQAKSSNVISALRYGTMMFRMENEINKTMIDMKLNRELLMRHELHEKMLKAHKTKTLISLKALCSHVQNERRKDEKQKDVISLLLSKCRGNSKIEAHAAYRRMIEFARNEKLVEQRYKSCLSNMILRANASRKELLERAMRKLMLHKNQLQIADKIGERCLKRVMGHLAKSSSNSLRDAFSKLLRNRRATSEIEERQQDCLRRMLNFAGNNSFLSMLKAYRKLKENADESQRLCELRSVTMQGLFNGLIRACKFKSSEVIDKLKSRLEQEREANYLKTNACRLVQQRLAFMSESCLERAYRKLKENVQISNSQEAYKNNKMKSMLAMLVAGSRAKEAIVIRELNKNRNLLDDEARERDNGTRKLLRLLAYAQSSKQREALDSLNDHKDYDKMKNLEIEKLRGILQAENLKNLLIQKLIKAQIAKKNDATQRLKVYSMSETQKLVKEADLKRMLFRHLERAQNGKKSHILSRMNLANRDAKVHNDFIRRILNRVFKESKDKLKGSAFECYRRMKEFSAISSAKSDLKDKTLSHLLNVLASKQRSKLNEAFSSFGKNSRAKQTAADMKNTLIRNLVRAQLSKQADMNSILRRHATSRTRALRLLMDSLKNGLARKSSNALKGLRENLAAEKERDSKKDQMLRLMLLRLKNNCYANEVEAFSKLSGSNSMSILKKRAVLAILLDRIVRKRYMDTLENIKNASKLEKYRLYMNGLMNWRLHNTEQKALAEKSKFGHRMASMINLLNIIESIFNKEKKNGFDRIAALSETSPTLTSIIQSMGERYKRRTGQTLRKLIQNCLQGRILDEKMRRLFDAFGAASQSKQLKATHTLQNMKLAKSHLAIRKAEKVRELAEKSAADRRRNAFQALNEVIYRKNLLKKIVNQANAHIARSSLQRKYDALLFNNALKKNASELAIIANFQRKIAHNAKEQLRTAFKNLLGLNKRSHFERLVHLLERLAAVRKQHAFDSIVYLSEIQKRESIRNGIINLIRCLDKLRERRVEAAYNKIKGDNPWRKRVVNIMTLKTHANQQISFWRLKYQNNIGEALVPAQQAIAIKKLVQVCRKKISKNLTRAFWRIDQGFHTPEHLDVSFAVIPNRSTLRNNLGKK